jgi:pimeloyl-ACP methyl ester carboxylesterase
LGSVVTGAAAGYLAERALLRPRFQTVQPTDEIGRLTGEQNYLRGPEDVRLLVETYEPARPLSTPPVPEIVLSHGFSLSGRCWHEQVAALRDRFRLVTYDQPGHGRSSAPRSGTYSLDLLADSLATVIQDATDAERGRLLLVGHSMGGMAVLAFARRHRELFASRVGALLLLSTTARSGTEDLVFGMGIQLIVRAQRNVERVAGLFGDRARRLARVYRASSDLSFALTREIGLARDADPRYVELTEQLILDTELETVGKLAPVLLSMDEDETLANVSIPTVIVNGVEDRITPMAHARHMAEVNPDVELIELPGVGHMTPLEAHDVVNALIMRLVDATRDASAWPSGGLLAQQTSA